MDTRCKMNEPRKRRPPRKKPGSGDLARPAPCRRGNTSLLPLRAQCTGACELSQQQADSQEKRYTIFVSIYMRRSSQKTSG